MNRVLGGWTIVSFFAATILFYAVTLTGKQTPVIPDDIMHDQVITSAGCHMCHAPSRQQPLSENHPRGAECMSCHKVRLIR